LRRTPLAIAERVEAMPKIRESLSMAYFGYFARVLRGGIYRRATANGMVFTAAFAGGATKEFGSKFSKLCYQKMNVRGF